ncbi:MAG: N-6 DNA methylase [Planctomycetota bacterium]|nr:N-6 DNA methylase [Planctomycetota bacterium]
MARNGDTRRNGNGRALNTQQAVNAAVKGICDIMRRSNCAGALQYVPELTWILFLRILDERETREAEEAEAVGAEFRPSLESPYRWRDWAASYDLQHFMDHPDDDTSPGWKRYQLTHHGAGVPEAYKSWINAQLIPHVKGLRSRPNATPRQKVISEIFSSVERVRIDTERNLQEVLDRVHALSEQAVDPTHVFPLSQVYEGLLLKMGEKGNDGGQFFTPRQVIKAMVQAVNPTVGETVYDPGCGTAGFCAQSYEHMLAALGDTGTAEQREALKRRTFYGREKDNVIYPIALANLVLHGVDQPNLWHGNTLTGQETYGGLFQDAPAQFDVILTNPPFGGKEGKEAQTRFAYKTRATQVLFLQHIIDSLKPGGRCGIVLDEGVLFRTNESAFLKTKRKLLDECDLWCIVTLPPGTFVNAGAGVKTDLLFFTKGRPTERIWYCDLSGIKVGKKTPLTLAHFEEFFQLLPTRADSERSWTVDLVARRQLAAQEAEPIRHQARAKEQEAAQWRDRLAELKKAAPRGVKAITDAEQRAATLTKEARELAGQAEDIEATVYDLKAVNPHTRNDEDTRTPEELLDLIDAKGREIAEALAALRSQQRAST